MSTEEGGTSQTQEIIIDIPKTEEKGVGATEKGETSGSKHTTEEVRMNIPKTEEGVEATEEGETRGSKHTEKNIPLEPRKKKKRGLGTWTITFYIAVIVLILLAIASTILTVEYYEIVQREIRKEKPHEIRDSLSIVVCVFITLMPYTIWGRLLIRVLNSKSFKKWLKKVEEKVERWWSEKFKKCWVDTDLWLTEKVKLLIAQSGVKQVIIWMTTSWLWVQQSGKWLRSLWLVEKGAEWLFILWKGARYCLFSLGLLNNCRIWLITSLFLVGSVVISTPAKNGMYVFASLVSLLASTILCQTVVIDRNDYGMFEMILALVLTQFRNVRPEHAFRNLFGIAVSAYVVRDFLMSAMKKLKKLWDEEKRDQKKTEEKKEPKEGVEQEKTGKDDFGELNVLLNISEEKLKEKHHIKIETEFHELEDMRSIIRRMEKGKSKV